MVNSPRQSVDHVHLLESGQNTAFNSLVSEKGCLEANSPTLYKDSRLNLMTTDVFGNPNVLVRNHPKFESRELKDAPEHRQVRQMILHDTIEMPAEIGKYFEKMDLQE